MKRVLFLLLLTVFVFADTPKKIYCQKSNTFVSWQDMIKSIESKQVIYVGELHNHQAGHQVELEILESVFTQNTSLAVSLEMFERDVQFLLDGYLQGQIPESFFLEHSRPWGNYNTDYRPLVEFSKAYGLSVVAANVPRRYAAFVARGKDQTLYAMPEAEKKNIAKEIQATPGRYRDKFYKVMENHVPPAIIEKYYRSQSLKDDTMAMSIHQFLEKNPEHTVISYTGAFHSDEGLGLVEKVDLQSGKAYSKVVISIVPVADLTTVPVALHKHKGDFVIFAPENQERESSQNQLIDKHLP